MAENSEKQRKPRGRGRPFVKGQSGNPGGRPHGYEAFRESFRAEKDLKKIRKRLLKEISTGKGSDAVNASRLWFEYGFGKAPAAPEDNEALAGAGGGWPLNRAETLALAKGK